jgi:type I restriction enzyme S subunit
MKKSLCEISNPKQWKTISTDMLKEEGYPVYGANGVIGYYSEYNHKEKTLLITCRGATCGSLNICEPYSYVNGNAMALDDLSEEVDIDYLYFYLLNRGLSDTITGTAQPQIVRQSLKKVEIEYPDINQQTLMVKKLNCVISLIDKRKKQLEKLDELVKSRFVDMFGDVENKCALSEICSIITDGTHQPPKFIHEGIPFLFVSNIVTNEINYNAAKFISEETYKDLYRRTPIEIGDIILSTVGSYGHPAIVKSSRKFLFQRHIAYLKPNSSIINPIYLHSAILSDDIQRQIDESVKGVAQKTLNLSEIKKILVAVPRIEQQNQFADFVEQIEKLKSEVQKGLEKLELLKNALMQEYFG